MADVKISALPAATTPLAGTEVLPIVQSSTTKQVAVSDLTAGRAMSASSLTLSTPLSVANGGTGLTSLTAGYIPYGNGTGAFGSSSNLFWDSVNGRFGLGTTSPAYLLDVNAAIVRFGNGSNGGFMQLGSDTTAANNYYIGSYGGNFTFYNGNYGAGTQLATLTASGNLGLGVTPSAFSLPAFQSTYGIFAGTSQINISGNAYYNAGWKYIQAGVAATRYSQQAIGAGSHVWEVAASGTAGSAISFTQAMTLTSSGDLLVGTASTSGARFNSVAASDSQRSIFAGNFGSSNTTDGLFYAYSGTARGTGYNFFSGQNATGIDIIIYGNGDIQNRNNSYAGISDISLKENVTEASSKLDDLLSVRIVNYNFKDDKLKQIGVIAQELEKIFPGLVETSPRDGLKSVKYSVFTPIIIKALQELAAKVSALEAKQ